MLAHELRNYIAPIRNAVHLLKQHSAADPALPPMLDVIERQVAGIVRTLETVIDADRLMRGEVTLHSERVELATITASVMELKRALIESRGQRLHAASAPVAVWLHADQARLTQALASVLDNAARYTGEGGEIWLETVAGVSGVEVHVRDNGSGIAADVLPNVFASFAMRAGPRHGLGVGLAVARALIEQHGGRIEARSGGEGQGSEFVIFLPVAGEARHEAARPAGGAEPGRSDAFDRSLAAPATPRRILVADDSAAVRNSFADVLRQKGHEVELAADGMETLDVAQRWRPEFVLVDVHMPKINGYEVARALRAKFPPQVMRLVMMSGMDLDETTLHGAMEAGFDHCIDKTSLIQGIDMLLRQGDA